MPKKLTKKVVERLRPGDKVFDTEVKGFFIRWQKGGKSKVFGYRYRMGGKDRTATIGKYGPIGHPRCAHAAMVSPPHGAPLAGCGTSLNFPQFCPTQCAKLREAST